MVSSFWFAFGEWMDESYVKQDFAQAQDHLFATRACIISHNVLRQTGGGQQEQPTRALRASIQALCAVQGPLDRALSQQAEIYQVPFSGTVEIRGTVAEESCSDLGGGGGGGKDGDDTHKKEASSSQLFKRQRKHPPTQGTTHPPTHERTLAVLSVSSFFRRVSFLLSSISLFFHSREGKGGSF